MPHPSQGDLETIAINVEARVLTWLGRRGFLAKPDDDTGEQQDSRSALDACLEGSLGLGELTALPGGALGNDDLALPIPSKPPRRAGRSRGFDINAGVVVSASDHEERERLLRYCARPALSLERLSSGGGSSRTTEPAGERPAAAQGRDARGSGAAARPTPAAMSTSRAEPDAASELERFSFGRIDWAALLKRVHDVDALACPCGGRLRFIALVLEREVAQSVLQSLGLPDRPPPIARARSPDLRDPIPPDE